MLDFTLENERMVILCTLSLGEMGNKIHNSKNCDTLLRWMTKQQQKTHTTTLDEFSIMPLCFFVFYQEE